MSIDATADSIAGFKYDYSELRRTELAPGRKSRSTCANNDHVSVHTSPMFAKIRYNEFV
jgi:hypothetical protein